MFENRNDSENKKNWNIDQNFKAKNILIDRKQVWQALIVGEKLQKSQKYQMFGRLNKTWFFYLSTKKFSTIRKSDAKNLFLIFDVGYFPSMIEVKFTHKLLEWCLSSKLVFIIYFMVSKFVYFQTFYCFFANKHRQTSSSLSISWLLFFSFFFPCILISWSSSKPYYEYLLIFFLQYQYHENCLLIFKKKIAYNKICWDKTKK